LDRIIFQSGHPMSIPLDTLDTPPPSPAGSVLTSLEPGRAIVWLSGEIDLALAEILGHLARNLHLLVPHVVLEVSRMTFCDSTLISFVNDLAATVPVTIRRPDRLLCDLLETFQLTERVQIANFPGVAAPLPA
jgi:hypothetical protein